MFTVNFLEISITFVLKLYSLNVIKKSRIESRACESNRIKSGHLNRYPALIGSGIYFFILTQVPLVYMGRAGFMTCTAASHQGAIKVPAASLFRMCEAHPDRNLIPLSTSRKQVLVQSQCYCQFLVGSTGEPFKNRLLFHRLESQYRARFYVSEYISCLILLARQRQTSDWSIGTQHTKAPRKRSKSIKSRLLSSSSRNTLMPRTERSAQCRSIPNKPKQTINNGGCCIAIDVHGFATYIGIQTRRIQRVRV